MQRSQLPGSRIKELRIQQGLSLRRLGGSAFVNASTLSRLEQGKTRCSSYTIAQVAKSLSVSPVEIDPDFNQKVLAELASIEADLKRIEEYQGKVSELQSSIAHRQRMIVSCLLGGQVAS
ncbi:hypothetical protein NIES2135_53370 [Leptolyngbya boryana NIES-2135]|jgi:transcriptional regulator with XRE-family HTH domain|uniref:HTH cro/C1-type domain-containing protein n=1 Tax=Leptolyngbya boryana NIES-2135 TaxID=1973484 RepID=A0A1Z4JP25_LEPBY|nr:MULTISPECIES: helix-turn-helix transcriptional regulator [Leptolyngbya]BAY58464.1 hypothetical protein NIES2135_53370 [Leptolyngbya boryana NIES-2135]MBD2370937.1 helix-turn-helix domain-containing protein [Leptolyngbya sp. FACHB-161]MBD2377451.1 helix-turn-helix domain-containing protein [Leptolyngbya sp. FACHB-238]MBD2401859.1 helix-turn-helix domain-containing protein [Leptolyngbya sp. FACHB-239]MBD2408377.1 helix-turn-helix domain-containing protein [Leptolyngbya sp. FACHB-402]